MAGLFYPDHIAFSISEESCFAFLSFMCSLTSDIGFIEGSTCLSLRSPYMKNMSRKQNI